MESTCVAMIGFEEETIMEENQLEKLKLRRELRGLRMERLQVRMRMMVKGGGDVVADWIWKLCNMTFESGVVSEDVRSAVIVPLYKSKGEMIKCKS